MIKKNTHIYIYISKLVYYTTLKYIKQLKISSILLQK